MEPMPIISQKQQDFFLKPIPEISAIMELTRMKQKYVTWGESPSDNSGYNPTFKIPQVQGGMYIKVWWDGMSER